MLTRTLSSSAAPHFPLPLPLPPSSMADDSLQASSSTQSIQVLELKRTWSTLGDSTQPPPTAVEQTPRRPRLILLGPKPPSIVESILSSDHLAAGDKPLKRRRRTTRKVVNYDESSSGEGDDDSSPLSSLSSDDSTTTSSLRADRVQHGLKMVTPGKTLTLPPTAKIKLSLQNVGDDTSSGYPTFLKPDSVAQREGSTVSSLSEPLDGYPFSPYSDIDGEPIPPQAGEDCLPIPPSKSLDNVKDVKSPKKRRLNKSQLDFGITPLNGDDSLTIPPLELFNSGALVKTPKKRRQTKGPPKHLEKDDGVLRLGTKQLLVTVDECHDANGQLKPEYKYRVQQTNCQRLDGENIKWRCCGCIQKLTGYVCSFVDLRTWIVHVDAPNSIAAGPLLNSVSAPPHQVPKYPEHFNRLATQQDLDDTRQTTGRVLLSELTEELSQLDKYGDTVVDAGRNLEHRLECDWCKGTLLGLAWVCLYCGTECCINCFSLFGTTDKAEEARRTRNANPVTATNDEWLAKMQRCNKHCVTHEAQAFIPVTHSKPEDLQDILDKIKLELNSPHKEEQLSCKEIDSYTGLDATVEPFLDSGGLTSEAVPRMTFQQLADNPDVFDSLWKNGMTLVVSEMNERFKIPWTPEYLSELYGNQSCFIENTAIPGSTLKRTTVGEFFQQFQSTSAYDEIWKLKDWPPSSDFKVDFPTFFEDFQNALPVPDITRRDGILNIASHFPANANVPDIGPKMYIAMASADIPGSCGSTRLHMDVADAINVQLYAQTKDGSEGCALWHIFRHDDTPKLREYLYNYRARIQGVDVDQAKRYEDDPIHSQRIYLDVNMRKELFDEYGVRPWEIYQKVGDAVFIPAYSAHQVCNLANCIKVAADFVSHHSVKRCLLLTREFRQQTHEIAKPWREDILQLKNMLLHAYKSCSRPSETFKKSNFKSGSTS